MMIKTTAVLFCIALIVLPFSIAAGNALFGFSLLLGLISKHWWHGAIQLWQQARWLTIFFGAYMLLMLLGLLWSPDTQRGWVIISKQWSWLMVPLVIVICQDKPWLKRVLWSLSIGLGLHLILCVAQSQGIPLPVAAPGGSSQADPAGLIGHISFGLLYGIWAAWLLHLGWLQKNKWRYALWAVSLWAVVMVFIGQGRSGYLVILVLTMVMAWKLWLQHLSLRMILGAIVVMMVALVTIMMGPAKERIQWTVDSLKAFSHGDLQDAEARLSLWYVSWEAWKQSPILGIGTGGFPSVTKTIIAQHKNLNMEGHDSFSVPHNIYIMELTRWGPLGLIILLLWLGVWIRMGWKVDWEQPHQLLIALSGIGLATHGFTSQAVEEYHASMYAGIFLAIGLASLSSKAVSTAKKEIQ
ncbi:MAG: O-antigen ligase family protein [Mariprofundaceae bacterium]|nr:O-antigen ligase family protein [Mariprofundaceae bacterium]